jgi:alkylation response protein AidB-like acyl-CoA dehydrogenase
VTEETAELDEFRRTVRRWLTSEAPTKSGPGDFSSAHVERAASFEEHVRSAATTIESVTSWQRRIDEIGWGALGWPEEYGGRGEAFRQVFAEEQARVGVTTKPLSVGVEMVGPTLIALGSEGQKRRHLARIRSGEEIWCQLFSEPDAGSDLPSLRTSAVEVSDGWRLSGQKVWTSGASFSHFGLALARTDPSTTRHAGISAFIVDMADPGIDVRPLRQLSGAYHFNEVFLSNVFVPRTGLIGELGLGWTVAITMLGSERASLGGGTSSGSPDELIGLAHEVGRSSDPRVRNELGALYSRASVLRWSMQRAQGGEPRLGALLKIQYSEHARQMTTAALDLLGSNSVARAAGRDDDPKRVWEDRFLFAPGLRIAGGTDEIQRNTIAERILGLPREPRSGAPE